MFLSCFVFPCEKTSQLIWDYHDTVEKAATINTVLRKRRISDSMLSFFFFHLIAALRHTGGD